MFSITADRKEYGTIGQCRKSYDPYINTDNRIVVRFGLLYISLVDADVPFASPKADSDLF